MKNVVLSSRNLPVAVALFAASVAVCAVPSFAQTTSPDEVPVSPAPVAATDPSMTTTDSTIAPSSVTTNTASNTAPSESAATGSTSSAIMAPIPVSANSGGSKKDRFTFGPEVGVYMPYNNKVRNTFGQAWFSLGFGVGKIDDAPTHGQFQADIRLLSASRSSGREAFIAPINFNYRSGFKPTSTSTPYIGAGVSLVGTQLRSDPMDVSSRFRGTYGANFFTGVSFKQRGYIQARYFALAPTRGYDLSGLMFAGGYRF